MPELLNMGLHFLRPGGLLAAMRGPREEATNPKTGQAIDIKGYYLEKLADFHLPITGVSRKIILYKKI